MEYKEVARMEFYKLPANAEALLHEILQADNPVDMLCERISDYCLKDGL